MAKAKTSFFCQSCGHSTPKWIGKCPSCEEWNTFVEEVIEKTKEQTWKGFTDEKKINKAIALQNVSEIKEAWGMKEHTFCLRRCHSMANIHFKSKLSIDKAVQDLLSCHPLT